MMDGSVVMGRQASPSRMPAPRVEIKFINLALQGGGAHGAFAWGVLDRLLEDEHVAFEGISAASAGAINAVVLACGLAEGGRQGAKRALAKLWRRIAHLASLTPLQPSLYDRLFGSRSLDLSPAFTLFDLMTRLFSAYQLNPFNYNPLRQVLTETIDFRALRSDHCSVKLFLSATNVRTGKIKVFRNDEIGPDAVLASACLPLMFQAVEIDGEHYWDGGYMGDPPIFPLIYGCDSRDVVIVHINPLRRAKLPTTASEIMNRINEISFNSSLMREMRAVAFVTKLIDDGKILDNSMKRMLIHSIEAADVMSELGALNKLNADWDNLNYLMRMGRERADAWLQKNFGRLGEESTIDIREEYL
jgi:NTE family protein